jgi:hypothetical protein
MKRPAIWISLVTVSLLLATCASAQEPSEASFVSAWERCRKAEPQTLTLEKIEEGRYRFKTKAFPFDGELKVLSVSIGDPYSEEYVAGMTPGTVEVELVGFAEDTARKYAGSFARWQMGNTLYFDRDAGRWLTAKEWQAKIARKYGRWSWLGWVSGSFWFLFLLVLAVFLWWVARRSGRQMKEALAGQRKVLADHEKVMAIAERSLAASEESNRLLAEILEELRKRQ